MSTLGKVNILKNKVIFLMLLLSSTLTHAGEMGCEDAIKLAFKHFNLKSLFKTNGELNKSNIITRDCRVLPNDKNTLLLGVIYDIPDNPTSDDKKSIVVMVDIVSQKIVSSYQYTIYHDGTFCVPTYRLALDLANYQLTPKIRAFGYRITNPGSCPACINSDDKLTLFVREGKNIRPILVNLAMGINRTIGGCNGLNRAKDSYMEVDFLTLGVEKTKSHGYADLLLKTKANYAYSPVGNEKRSFPETQNEYYLLHYDGKQYRPVAQNQPWWVLLDANETVHHRDFR